MYSMYLMYLMYGIDPPRRCEARQQQLLQLQHELQSRLPQQAVAA